MTLYRQYRPQNFADLRGQDHVVEVLQSSLKKDKAAHAYLFTGPRGTGKTSTARILGRALNCTDLKDSGPCNVCESCISALEERLTDFIEIDAASHGLVDDARALVEQAKFMPSQVKRKVYIIDEVHMLSKSAFNALLKIIEEPPDHVHFIMATTEAHKVLETIKSRCQRFDFHLSDEEKLSALILDVATQENLSLDAEALALLARHARGSYRDALSLLEQFTGMKNVTEAEVRHILGLSDAEKTVNFVDSLIAQDTSGCLEKITAILRDGHDPYQFCQALLGEMRKRLLEHESFPLDWVENFYEALEKLRSPLLPELPLELAVYRCHRSEGPREKVQVPGKKVQSEKVIAVKEKPESKSSTEKEINAEEIVSEMPLQTSSPKMSEDGLQDDNESLETSPVKTGTFVDHEFIKSIDQASLRTLVKFSELEFRDNVLKITARSDFEIRKMKDNENLLYLMDLLEKHMGTKTTINFTLGESTSQSDGLSSTDLESVF
jgi:DNA polymerase III subunit gamma/tau